MFTIHMVGYFYFFSTDAFQSLESLLTVTVHMVPQEAVTSELLSTQLHTLYPYNSPASNKTTFRQRFNYYFVWRRYLTLHESVRNPIKDYK